MVTEENFENVYEIFHFQLKQKHIISLSYRIVVFSFVFHTAKHPSDCKLNETENVNLDAYLVSLIQ